MFMLHNTYYFDLNNFSMSMFDKHLAFPVLELKESVLVSTLQIWQWFDIVSFSSTSIFIFYNVTILFSLKRVNCAMYMLI